jgi:hypothetical protein
MRDQLIVSGLTLRDFATGFHLRARTTCALAASLFLSTGCHRQASAPRPSEVTASTLTALALIPADAQLVLGADLDRLRAQAAWETVFPAMVRTVKPLLQRLEGDTGLDLTRQLHHLVVALPSERQKDDRFVVVADVEGLDEKRSLDGLRARLGGSASVELLAHQRLVIRRGVWANARTSLATLDENSELRRLSERAAAGHGVWFAAIVPTSVRRKLMQDSPFADVASLARVSGHLDLHSGLAAEVAGELMTAVDATDLVHRLSVYLNQMKRNPDMLVSGLAPIWDAVHLSLDNATVHARLELPSAQLGDYVERFESLAHAGRTK